MSRKWIFIVSLLFIALCGVVIAVFLPIHEVRADTINWQLDDFAFKLLPVADVSIPIFSITYGSIALYIIGNNKRPMYLSKAFFSYGILLLMRIITLSVIPLKEPDSIVLLEDPFLNNIIYSSTNVGDLINADLFFSGHTALLFGIYFLSGRKLFYLILGVILALLLLIQRVHYSVDIIGAVIFAYIAVRISEYLILRLSKRS